MDFLNKDSDVVTIHPEYSNFIKISTIGDGTCFIHSLLKCCYTEYQNTSNINERKNIAYEIRNELIESLKEPNEKYPTFESVIQFVKLTFFENFDSLSNAQKGLKFGEFLKVAYNFDYIPYPKNIRPYDAKYFDSLIEYHKYFIVYRDYLQAYNKFLNQETHIFPIFEGANPKSGDRSHILLQELTPEIKDFIQKLELGYSQLINRVQEIFHLLQFKLETELGNELYNPQNFGVPYIQAHLKGLALPKSEYSELPYNCYFFTSNSGCLYRFASYHENLIPGFNQIVKILSNFRLFLGDEDILPFIPSIFEVNILVVNFEENQILQEYVNDSNTPWIIISNTQNVHFEACGLEINGKYQTLFEPNNNFIQFLLNAKNNKGIIDWKKLI